MVNVTTADDSVTLSYAGNAGNAGNSVVKELQRLVDAEQDCCGAAGVEFTLSARNDLHDVTISVTRQGLPASTVLDAFAAFSAE